VSSVRKKLPDQPIQRKIMAARHKRDAEKPQPWPERVRNCNSVLTIYLEVF
jgi:hypothetical protein